MGMSISAKLMYGLDYEDLVDDMDEDSQDLLREEIYERKWDSAPPWYAAATKESFIGVSLPKNFSLEALNEFLTKVREAEDLFVSRFGKKGYVQTCVNVF